MLCTRWKICARPLTRRPPHGSRVKTPPLDAFSHPSYPPPPPPSSAAGGRASPSPGPSPASQQQFGAGTGGGSGSTAMLYSSSAAAAIAGSGGGSATTGSILSALYGGRPPEQLLLDAASCDLVLLVADEVSVTRAVPVHKEVRVVRASAKQTARVQGNCVRHTRGRPVTRESTRCRCCVLVTRAAIFRGCWRTRAPSPSTARAAARRPRAGRSSPGTS